jgi:Multicopper oxidase
MRFHILTNRLGAGIARLFPAVLLAMLLLPGMAAAAFDDFITGTNFHLTARQGNIASAPGESVYMWGYSNDDGPGAGTMQLPGPTLNVTEGQTINVTLHNALPVAAGNVSILFPGQVVSTSGGVPGALTQEAPNGGSVTYTFTANRPGTFQYHSGSQPDLQVEMGLYGALIVRPASVPTGCTAAAYDHAETCYDREYLFLLSEIDLDIHEAAALQVGGPGPIVLPVGAYASEFWLMNGRTGPDTMASSSIPGSGILPTQPYGSLALMHPGEKVLIRLVGAGRESHPFHHHGNHARVLANDAHLLLSATDTSKLAGPLLFTLPSTPGGTTDAIWEWTGKDLGWDIYGNMTHNCVDVVNNVTGAAGADGYDDAGDNAWEWCADHGKDLPVTLPDLSSLVFGGYWSGSPYMGDLGSLPPGEGGLNPDAGFTFIWHSHTERELVNNDLFPGGMMTFMIVEAPWVTIP